MGCPPSSQKRSLSQASASPFQKEIVLKKSSFLPKLSTCCKESSSGKGPQQEKVVHVYDCAALSLYLQKSMTFNLEFLFLFFGNTCLLLLYSLSGRECSQIGAWRRCHTMPAAWKKQLNGVFCKNRTFLSLDRCIAENTFLSHRLNMFFLSTHLEL